MASQIPCGTGLPDNEVDAENTKGQEVQSSAERLDPAVPEINHPEKNTRPLQMWSCSSPSDPSGPHVQLV
jgi:hypothetical protein